MEVVTGVVTAVIIFVAGQLLQRFVFDPIQEQKRIIGEIAYHLTYSANVGIGQAAEEIAQTRQTLRDLAARLRASEYTIPRYGFLARLGWVRKPHDIRQAATQLIGWSNSLDSGKGGARRDAIATALGIEWK